MTLGNVRPNIMRLTDADARQLVADGIVRTCGMPGPGGVPMGPSRVGLEIGCDEKTVRRARDGESTLGVACTLNLLDVNPAALDALLAAKGFRIVRLTMLSSRDVVSSSGAVLHKIGLAGAVDSPGGPEVLDSELEAMEHDVTALEEAAASLRSRIALAKLRRAA